jgi:cytoskeletal protein CcmA (bactofilin family)
MDTPALIGASIRIKGEITAREPLTIAGHVDGSVTVEGHALTIVAGGQATANVTADVIVVAGTVNGRLNAGTRIIVRETAVIDGDLTAPSVSLADGATVCGRIETAERKAKLALAS